MIQVQNLSKSFGDQELFKNMTFNLNKGERVGLVGRNGSGKSTLFKILLSEELPDSGQISLPKNYQLGALRQHLEFHQSSVLEECLTALPEEERDQEFRAEKILMGLGFQSEDMSKSPSSFSGGYQIRINLAKVLLAEPDCLLLDEPTNYLDIVSMRWLAKFLVSFKGEIILITHDRGFMDTVVTHTMGIHRGELLKIVGNTENYFNQVMMLEQNFEKERVKIDKKKKELEDFIDRFRAKATKASQAQSRLKYLEKLPELEALKLIETLDFEFNFKPFPGKTLMEVDSVSFGYDENLLFENLSFNIPIGAKIGIIGKNGKGKSTLLNLLAGEYEARKGKINRNINLSVGHFGQTNINRLNLNSSIEQEIASTNTELSMEKVRTICGTMMFSGDLATKKISVLSGGERARVLMGKLLAKPVNLLLLDEPTNHLDQDSIDSLIIELKNFSGSVVIVSHSETLLKEACDSLIVFQGDGPQYLNMSYEEFIQKVGWIEEKVQEVRDVSPKISRQEQKKIRSELIIQRSKELNPLKKIIQELEGDIFKLEERQRLLEIELIEQSAVLGKNKKAQDISLELGQIRKTIDEKFEVLTESSITFDELSKNWEFKLSQIEKN
jgi:ATP-binding cassette subfamily F protein 3